MYTKLAKSKVWKFIIAMQCSHAVKMQVTSLFLLAATTAIATAQSPGI